MAYLHQTTETKFADMPMLQHSQTHLPRCMVSCQRCCGKSVYIEKHQIQHGAVTDAAILEEGLHVWPGLANACVYIHVDCPV